MSELTRLPQSFPSPAGAVDGDGAIILRAEHLSKTYPDGRVNALVDVSLDVPRGEWVAVVGPSGSGKSTLLNLLGALDRPSAGEVYFDGKPLGAYGELSRLRARKVGFVFQSFHLLPTLTALENVQVPMFEGPLGAKARARKAAELLEAVGMMRRANHLPSRLSVGERQRVAIARALANDPVLLLADEPTGNLDSHTAEDVLDLFGAIQKDRGVTLVVVTHSREVAERGDRVIALKDGQVVEDRRSAPRA
jgi:putative ABC transport system ATP-binding protein